MTSVVQLMEPKRIQSELKERGIIVGRDRIMRLRREMGLKCKTRKEFRATTNSNQKLPAAPDHLKQKFDTEVPGAVWGTDITYIPTDKDWLYLPGVKNFCSKEIVGYEMSNRMTKELVRKALKEGIGATETSFWVYIHHSDRGSQYCSYDYQNDVKKAGFQASMSRRGNCYDNAPTESFWGTLKQELVLHMLYKTRATAIAAIQEYIEIFYNRICRHSVILPHQYLLKNIIKKGRLHKTFVSTIDRICQNCDIA